MPMSRGDKEKKRLPLHRATMGRIQNKGNLWCGIFDTDDSRTQLLRGDTETARLYVIIVVRINLSFRYRQNNIKVTK